MPAHAQFWDAEFDSFYADFSFPYNRRHTKNKEPRLPYYRPTYERRMVRFILFQSEFHMWNSNIPIDKLHSEYRADF